MGQKSPQPPSRCDATCSQSHLKRLRGSLRVSRLFTV
nr:MAG TPA: hypothetical protein [Caudoviricetes sp.]